MADYTCAICNSTVSKQQSITSPEHDGQRVCRHHLEPDQQKRTPELSAASRAELRRYDTTQPQLKGGPDPTVIVPCALCRVGMVDWNTFVEDLPTIDTRALCTLAWHAKFQPISDMSQLVTFMLTSLVKTPEYRTRHAELHLSRADIEEQAPQLLPKIHATLVEIAIEWGFSLNSLPTVADIKSALICHKCASVHLPVALECCCKGSGLNALGMTTNTFSEYFEYKLGKKTCQELLEHPLAECIDKLVEMANFLTKEN